MTCMSSHMYGTIIPVCLACSFHVGSHCKNPATYSKAIEMAAKVFQYGQELGFQFTLLDIGGGFPGREELHGLFLDMARAINEALEKHFSRYPHVKVIAEPGEYRMRLRSAQYSCACCMYVV